MRRNYRLAMGLGAALAALVGVVIWQQDAPENRLVSDAASSVAVPPPEFIARPESRPVVTVSPLPIPKIVTADSIAIRILDAATLKGIPNATVTPMVMPPVPGSIAPDVSTSDHDGRVEIPAAHWLKIEAEGFASKCVEPRSRRPDDRRDIHLTAQGEVTVRVTDTRGNPIPKLRTAIIPLATRFEVPAIFAQEQSWTDVGRRVVGETNERGEVTLIGLPLGKARVCIQTDDFVVLGRKSLEVDVARVGQSTPESITLGQLGVVCFRISGLPETAEYHPTVRFDDGWKPLQPARNLVFVPTYPSQLERVRGKVMRWYMTYSEGSSDWHHCALAVCESVQEHAFGQARGSFSVDMTHIAKATAAIQFPAKLSEDGVGIIRFGPECSAGYGTVRWKVGVDPLAGDARCAVRIRSINPAGGSSIPRPLPRERMIDGAEIRLRAGKYIVETDWHVPRTHDRPVGLTPVEFTVTDGVTEVPLNFDKPIALVKLSVLDPTGSPAPEIMLTGKGRLAGVQCSGTAVLATDATEWAWGFAAPGYGYGPIRASGTPLKAGEVTVLSHQFEIAY